MVRPTPVKSRLPDEPGWSPWRTAATVVVLASAVAGVIGLVQLLPRMFETQPVDASSGGPDAETRLRTAGDRGIVGDLPPIDVKKADRAIQVLENWPRLNAAAKKRAAEDVAKVFEMGGVTYLPYIETNREMICDILKRRRTRQLVREAEQAQEP